MAKRLYNKLILFKLKVDFGRSRIYLESLKISVAFIFGCKLQLETVADILRKRTVLNSFFNVYDSMRLNFELREQERQKEQFYKIDQSVLFGTRNYKTKEKFVATYHSKSHFSNQEFVREFLTFFYRKLF